MQDPTTTARDFYIAYLALSESNERVRQVIASDNPHSVSPLMMERLKSGELKQVLGAHIVCLAFALELYLKAVLVHSGGKVPRTHNLFELFHLVPGDVRARILAVFQARNQEVTEEAVIDNLQIIAKAFDEWRYVFEKGRAKFMPAFGMQLVDVLASIVEELKAGQQARPA